MKLPLTIFRFDKNSDITNWQVVNDGVMGGRSKGEFELNNKRHGQFSGTISLENNGGFSLLRYRFKTVNCSYFSKIVLRIKGDSKRYQFRIKAKQNDYYSYVTSFTTNNDWQIITINLKDMYPAFRGKALNLTNYDKETIEELAFLIGNKKEASFKLLIEYIKLQ